MKFQERKYQDELDDSIHNGWLVHRNVLAVSPTGSGKTVLFSRIIKRENGPSVVIAHRNSLVLQISRALNRNEVPHKLIAQKSVISEAVRLHVSETGKSFYDPSAKCGVAAVKTLLNRQHQLAGWLRQIKLWVTDEAHHLVASNSWGQAVDLMPNARGLGVTATPIRTDGKGLGRTNDGVFDLLVEGYSLRQMILDAWLVDYSLYAPPCDADFSNLKITASGDYSKNNLRAVEATSHIVGDVVEHYLRIARGKLGVTFASNMETARSIVEKFNAAGVPAVLVNANTPEVERFEFERRFKRRELLQLVNVDLFGEGYDLPQLEVISMARKTNSFSLFVQMCGRVLRPMYAEGMPQDTQEQRLAAIAGSTKHHGIIIDHVGNIARHGRAIHCESTGKMYIDLCFAQWSLEAGVKKSARPDDLIKTKVCPFCMGEYVGISRECPYCGESTIPTVRNSPSAVDGDLELLTPQALAKLHRELEYNTRSPVEVERAHIHAGRGVATAKRGAVLQYERLMALDSLGGLIDLYGGLQRSRGLDDNEAFVAFYQMFGVDILSARGLKKADAIEKAEKIKNYLIGEGVNYEHIG